MRSFLRFLIKCYRLILRIKNRVVNMVNLYANDVAYSSRPLISGILVIHNNGICRLGKNVAFNSYVANVPGSLNKTANIRIKKGAKLIVGDSTGFTNCVVWCDEEITIGKFSKFGTNTIIRDSDSHSLDYLERRKPDDHDIRTAPIKIGDDVFVGANSIILKGVTIGDRSIIAAGSIVTKSIPADEIWGGNPAIFIRKIAKGEVSRKIPATLVK